MWHRPWHWASRRARYVALAYAFGAALALAACGRAPEANAGASLSTPTQGAHIDLHGAVDRAVFDSPTAMCGATLVLDAMVASVGPSVWNTADGARPSPAYWQNLGVIITPFTVSGPRTLLDRRKQATEMFYSSGGVIGQDRVVVDGYPRPTAGRRYLLVFLPGALLAGSKLLQSRLHLSDAFTVSADERVILRPKTDEPGVGTPPPEVSAPLAQIEQQLAACPAHEGAAP